MIELELTFLARHFPAGLEKCESREIVDIYFPEKKAHPTIRLRKNGKKFELTKKEPLAEGNSSEMLEQTIMLREEEFLEFARLPGKKVSKIRHNYPFNGLVAEVDVFTEALEGLVLVDFEFSSIEEKAAFKIPEFCLAEVTQEAFVAGGMLCGKSFKDIEQALEKFGYKSLKL